MHRYQFSLIIIAILIIGLFFRTYKLIERFGFGHDGDLYSWIVKDIAIDHHPRLVGQVTSTDGIFVGPFFYYLLVPFYLLFNMDPIGSAYFPLLVAAATILSYYFVLSKLLNKQIGILAAFLHSIGWSTIGFDRWMVPTITTKLWAIWYLYALILISRGKFCGLALLGLLIGLIWHVHLALLPTLLAVPVALLLSKKIPPKKWILFALIAFVLSSLPLVIFEIKHNFIQFNALTNSFGESLGGSVGLYKLQVVLDQISKNITAFLLSPRSEEHTSELQSQFHLISLL